MLTTDLNFEVTSQPARWANRGAPMLGPTMFERQLALTAWTKNALAVESDNPSSTESRTRQRISRLYPYLGLHASKQPDGRIYFWTTIRANRIEEAKRAYSLRPSQPLTIDELKDYDHQLTKAQEYAARQSLTGAGASRGLGMSTEPRLIDRRGEANINKS